MANLKIHLPRELDPNAAPDGLTKMLREKVSEGITRKVARNVNGLRQLNVTPFDASLKLGTEFRDIKFRDIEWMDFDRPLKRTKQRPFDASLRMRTEFREIKFREIKFREIKFREIEWMDLNAELNFDR
jgi:hypothetical protein